MTVHGKTARGEWVRIEAVQVGATYRDFGDLVGGDTTGRQTPRYREELLSKTIPVKKDFE
jgi:hypothetical protein